MKFSIIGASRICSLYIDIFREEGDEIVSVFSRNAKYLKKFCFKKKIDIFSNNIEKFYEQSSKAEAIFILNKPQDHIFFLKKIINLNTYVFIEKPISDNYDEFIKNQNLFLNNKIKISTNYRNNIIISKMKDSKKKFKRIFFELKIKSTDIKYFIYNNLFHYLDLSRWFSNTNEKLKKIKIIKKRNNNFKIIYKLSNIHFHINCTNKKYFIPKIKFYTKNNLITYRFELFKFFFSNINYKKLFFKYTIKKEIRNFKYLINSNLLIKNQDFNRLIMSDLESISKKYFLKNLKTN